MNIVAYAISDVGRRRAENQDRILCRQDLGLYVVCDGMGGHVAGEVAAEIAVGSVLDGLEPEVEGLRRGLAGDRDARRGAVATVVRAVQEANRRVYSDGQEHPQRRGMGTTLTLLFVHGERGIVAQVGDSRMYLVRGDQAHQVTTDHTILTELLRAGRFDPATDDAGERNLGALTRAVGVHSEVEVDTLEIDILPGDTYLLCSDGLHGYFDDLDVAAFFRHSTRERAAENLVDMANKRGGHDNVSAITVFVEPGDSERADRVRLTLDALKTIPLFHYLSFAELLRIIPVCQPVEVSKGDQIIRDGTEGADFFLVIQGNVRVHKGPAQIAIIGPGRYFGEMSLVDSRPRSASVTADTDGHLIRISRSDFYELLRLDPVLAVKVLWNFIQTLSSMVRSHNAALGDLPDTSEALASPYQTGEALAVPEGVRRLAAAVDDAASAKAEAANVADSAAAEGEADDE